MDATLCTGASDTLATLSSRPPRALFPVAKKGLGAVALADVAGIYRIKGLQRFRFRGWGCPRPRTAPGDSHCMATARAILGRRASALFEPWAIASEALGPVTGRWRGSRPAGLDRAGIDECGQQGRINIVGPRRKVDLLC